MGTSRGQEAVVSASVEISKPRAAYFVMCSALMAMVIMTHLAKLITAQELSSLLGLGILINSGALLASLAGAAGSLSRTRTWYHKTVLPESLPLRRVSALIDFAWIFLGFPSAYVVNNVLDNHDVDHRTILTVNTFAATFLGLPISVTTPACILLVLPCYLFVDYRTFVAAEAATHMPGAANGAAGDELLATSFTPLWLAFLPRAAILVAVCMSVNMLGQVLLNGKALADSATAAASRCREAGEEHRPYTLMGKLGALVAQLEEIQLAGVRMFTDEMGVALKLVAALGCGPVVVWSFIKAFYGLWMHGNASCAAAVSPTMLLVAGISAAVVARLDFVALATSLVETQRQRAAAEAQAAQAAAAADRLQADLAALADDHEALLVERQALQAELELALRDYQPRAVIDAGTHADKLLDMLGGMARGERPALADIMAIQAAILNAVDIYQPVDLDDKLAAAELDADVGLNLLNILGRGAKTKSKAVGGPGHHSFTSATYSHASPPVSKEVHAIDAHDALAAMHMELGRVTEADETLGIMRTASRELAEELELVDLLNSRDASVSGGPFASMRGALAVLLGPGEPTAAAPWAAVGLQAGGEVFGSHRQSAMASATTAHGITGGGIFTGSGPSVPRSGSSNSLTQAAPSLAAGIHAKHGSAPSRAHTNGSQLSVSGTEKNEGVEDEGGLPMPGFQKLMAASASVSAGVTNTIAMLGREAQADDCPTATLFKEATSEPHTADGPATSGSTFIHMHIDEVSEADATPPVSTHSPSAAVHQAITRSTQRFARNSSGVSASGAPPSSASTGHAPPRSPPLASLRAAALNHSSTGHALPAYASSAGGRAAGNTNGPGGEVNGPGSRRMSGTGMPVPRSGSGKRAGSHHQLSQPQEPIRAVPTRALLDEVETVLLGAHDWHWDSFVLDAATKGRPLSAMAYFLFHSTGLISTFNLDGAVLARFLRRIEDGYKANPYHNAIHAADVLQTMHVIVHRSGMVPFYTSGLTLLATYLAAAVHDYEHVGHTNDFLINSLDPLSILYNDRAPMENHHLAATFALLRQPSYNFLAHLPRAEFNVIRKQVIDLVLGTDMKQHFVIMSQFNNVHRLQQSGGPVLPSNVSHLLEMRDHTDSGDGAASGSINGLLNSQVSMPIPTGAPRTPLDENERTLSLQLALKSADIRHTGAARDIHLKWLLCLEEEFFLQGDAEKARGLPVSPLFDRDKPGVLKSQVGFYDIVVVPMYRSLSSVFPGTKPLLITALSNYGIWLEKEQEAKMKEAEEFRRSKEGPSSEAEAVHINSPHTKP